MITEEALEYAIVLDTNLAMLVERRGNYLLVKTSETATNYYNNYEQGTIYHIVDMQSGYVLCTTFYGGFGNYIELLENLDLTRSGNTFTAKNAKFVIRSYTRYKMIALYTLNEPTEIRRLKRKKSHKYGKVYDKDILCVLQDGTFTGWRIVYTKTVSEEEVAQYEQICTKYTEGYRIA